MRLTKIFIALLILFSISGGCFGQEYAEDENWIREIGGAYSYGYPSISYQYNNFTKEDVTRAKQKLKFIKQFVSKNEWEGIYYSATVIGDSKLVWNSEGGFLNFYFYHELRGLDYGKINESLSFIELTSEKPLISNSEKKRAAKLEKKLIKVKFGERRFLVPESRLKDFCMRVAGLSTDLQDFYYYWSKEEDIKKKDFGLAILPEKYSHLLRYPIETEIIHIGSRKNNDDKLDDETVDFDEINYPITINAGKNKNVKRGMNFFVADLGEWIEIKKVLSNSSIGFVKRRLDENKQEQCFNLERGDGQVIPCKLIRVGMIAKTKGKV
jgi:hypothetical protein